MIPSRKRCSPRCESVGPAGYLPPLPSCHFFAAKRSVLYRGEDLPAWEGPARHRTVSGGLQWRGWRPSASFRPVPSGTDLPLRPLARACPCQRQRTGPPEPPCCFVREPQRLFVCRLPAGFLGARAEPGAAGARKEVRNVPGERQEPGTGSPRGDGIRAAQGPGRGINPLGLRPSVLGLLAERLMRGLRK